MDRGLPHPLLDWPSRAAVCEEEEEEGMAIDRRFFALLAGRKRNKMILKRQNDHVQKLVVTVVAT